MYGITENPASLVELLQKRALLQAEQRAYSFLLDEGEVLHITYGELDRQARSVGAMLQTMCKPGERALLLYQPGIDYLVAFFGCLYAGVFAVPAYPPRLNGNLLRLQSVAVDAKATLALTTRSILEGVERRFAETEGLATLKWCVTDELNLSLSEQWSSPVITSETLAFLQYTSGSTSAPKGVMLTHGNLLHNLDLIEEAFAVSPASRGVIWLPPYHDMGLIGGILNPLYTGYPVTLMAPVSFIQRPLRWLQAISETGATVSGGPNFAYDLCLQKVTPEQRDQLDLSSWTTAFSGAEPVRYETLKRFAEYFAPCGFREEAFYPCYGLAEGTLFVTGGLASDAPVAHEFQAEALEESRVVAVQAGAHAEAELPADGQAGAQEGATRMLVSSGRLSLMKQQVIIVSPETMTRCADDRVGEIWVSGPSVAKGYWERPDQTELTFQARLTDTGEGPFLRTGDLGFVQDGELYVTGRLKDLIIIRGRNFYPQDIEFTVSECHPAVGSSNGAAFSIEADGEERLVVVYEVERQFRKANLEDVIAAIREAVAEHHQLQVYAVVLIKPASIPKTSSGKIQRHACRSRFLDNELETIKVDVLEGGAEGFAPSAASTQDGAQEQELRLTRQTLLSLAEEERQTLLEAELRSRAAQVLRVNVSHVHPEQSLNAFGLDSMMAVEIKNELEEGFGIVLPLTDLLDGPSIRQLAEAVLARLEDGEEADADAGEEEFSIAGEFPLSEGQKSLLFLQRIAPKSAAYNISRAVRIGAGLDVEVLKQAFQTIVERHPLLRATFSAGEGQPVAKVQEGMEVAWSLVDARAWSEAFLMEQLEEEANRPFDLEQGPVFRALLFKREREHVLLLSIHHIVVDFWSFGVLVEELLTLYPARKAGEMVELPAPRIDYGMYVQAQRRMLDGAKGERLLNYWKQNLAGELPVLSLPTDRPRPAVSKNRGALQPFSLPAELSDKLKQLAKEKGVTLYMVLLAAFQALLHRYSGQDQVLVGSPTTGRSSAKQAGVIGYFVSPVVMRATFAEEMTFAALLEQVRQTVLGALEHQEYPFALLVDQLLPQRDLSVPPLFQTMFTLQKSHRLEEMGLTGFALGTADARMEAGGLAFEAVPLGQRFAQVDLALSMGEVNGALAGAFEFSTELFDRDTVERLAGHFEQLLAGVIENAASQIAELPLLGESERHQLLVEWNDTSVHYPQDVCLHQLFEAQVEKTPDAVALVFEGASWSYRELNERANSLAHYLRNNGVGPDRLVGVCMERSLEMVVALYGILKAGGAYVPIDPTYPADRLQFMLEDSDVAMLLTQAEVASALPPHGARLLCLDTEWDVIAEESVENPVCSTRDDQLAYMIYTSGSTGKPKGAMNEHRGIVNRLLWMQDAYRLTEQDRVLQKTPFSFDVSVWEFFWPLLVGARLVIAKPDGHKDAAYLAELIRTEGVTTLHFVPSMLQVFLEESGVETCSSIRQIMCSGEALPLELQERFFARMGAGMQLHNLYGPTEAAIDVTAWTCERGSDRLQVPIGRPISNTQMYVLDALLQPVPIGVAGELHIGGVQVARGYLNRPELTAEKFIPDPFAEQAGARLYKTGDLARYLKDGTIEYLGRLDFQVKIRGFRIELGEIEARLLQHATLRETVVTALADAGGHKRLVAYVVPSDAQAGADAEELRGHLRSVLPDYMVPALFVVLEALPLSPNGKVDRRALPIPEQARVETEFVAPRNRVEVELAAILAEVLGAEQVGIDDNYFDLGGDSIRSIQVLSKAQKVGLSFSLQDLFVYQTVRQLAEIVTVDGGEELPELAPFALLEARDREQLPAGIVDAYPLSSLQEGMLFHSQISPDSSVYHNVISVHLRAPYVEQAMARTVESVLTRHPVFRTSFDLTTYSESLQLVHETVPIPLKIDDIRDLPHHEQEHLLKEWFAEDVRNHFDWTQAPLVRFHIHRRTEESFQFSFTENHVITDGWSIASMLTEFFRTYMAECKGEKAPIGEPPAVLYRDFVALERTAARSEEMRKYWADLLAGYQFTQLPRWSAETGDLFGSSAVYRTLDYAVATDVKQGLDRLAQLARTPLKSVLLTAHLKVISLLSGQQDVVTGVVANGRPEVEDGERVIGLHLNSLPYRMVMEPGSWVELVQKTFAQDRAALPYRRYPMAKIQQDHGGQALFETLFNFINFHVYTSLQEIEDLEVLDHQDYIYTNFPFSIEFSVDVETNLQMRVQWDEREFSHAQIEVMAGYLLTALQEMAEHPQGDASACNLLSEAERQQVLATWNDTAVEYPQDLLLHELFEQQVERTPEQVAVVFEGKSLTYRELNERANRLAHHLQGLGVGPEAITGVFMDRSLEMVIGLYGILKAGGAYVPIDPTYPPDRIAFLLSDSQVQVLLTQEKWVSTLQQTDVQLLCLDSDWAEIAQASAENPARQTTPDNLAYMIYTSGSTGLPKGALNTHRGIVNRLLWMQAEYRLTEQDAVLQKTPFSFDVSVWEFFWPLFTGASLVVARPDGHKDASYLVEMIRAHRITTLHFVPSMLQVFLEEPDVESCTSIRRVICSGEGLPYELQERFFARLDVELHNLYGPTEAAIDVTYWACQRDSELNFVPIGRPVANTQMYVLDLHLQPVPIGTPGELYIGGVQLARGYHNRTELTAERFIPHPFSTEPGARLYKTGDLASFLPDGNIQYLGRLDDQVKIRGFRIELGEIENALLQHPSVDSAAVLVRKAPDGSQSLIAFYATDEEQLEATELKEFLASSLPEHMVPPHYSHLSAIPLSPNGKIDRRQLSELAKKFHVERSQEYVAPTSEIQEILTRIWSDVLQQDRIGIHDNFFDLGGHSLLVGKVYNELKKTLGVTLPMTDLFKYPTINMLAEAISKPDGEAVQEPRRVRTKAADREREQDVAIIGIGLRFPKANTADEFWESLRAGRECIEQFEADEMEPFLFNQDPANQKNLIRAGAFLENLDLFDAEFFGISEREASLMDPQQRLFLQCVWEAIEDAGYDIDSLEGAVSVYAGTGMNQYLPMHTIGTKMADIYQAMLASQTGYLATRTSYKLNLKGESMMVSTACSTSLVAVHMACKSLIEGQSDYAVAGGASIQVPHKTGYIYEPNFIMSADGHCRAFDSQASGTVPGNGVGVVFLKRLSDAVRDGDPIYAVIKGSAINNDGNLKIGFTAPSVQGQAEVIAMAQAAAGVGPESISYVEAHGTGTKLGDPIEVDALTQVFQAGTPRKQFCALGSVKTNIGHLDAAAGVAGLIKTALALQNGEIPPSLHYEEPNPAIDFANSPFYVNTALSPWKSDGKPRRAGVSSFGIGGTNAHVILEEPPAVLRQR